MFFPHCCPSLLMKRGTVQVHKNPPPAKPEKPKSRGFRNTLRNLRDRLRTDHKTLVRPYHLILLHWCSPFVFYAQIQFITLLLYSPPLCAPLLILLCPLRPSQTAAHSDPVVQRRHLERSDLQNFNIKDLNALCMSLSQATQGTHPHTVITLHLSAAFFTATLIIRSNIVSVIIS